MLEWIAGALVLTIAFSLGYLRGQKNGWDLGFDDGLRGALDLMVLAQVSPDARREMNELIQKSGYSDQIRVLHKDAK